MKRSWVPITSITAALLLACVHGCGSDRPNAAVVDNSGFQSNVQTGACSNEGQIAACHVVLAEHAGYVDCFNSTQTCTNGTWGPCGALGGTVATHAYTPPTLSSPGDDTGSLSTLSLSSSAMCTTDPCNPGCKVFNEAPAMPVVPTCAMVVVPAVCGNGMLESGEQCDDGNVVNGDGCNATCGLEVGFKCPMPGSPCVAATCGNGMVEGLEQCDDGPWTADSTGTVKDRPYDGCYQCKREVNCPVGAGPGPTACTAVCGDGLLFPGETCDDGNTTNGDGCSSTCTIEPGSTCVTVTAPLPAYLDVPAIYRDFDTFGGYVTAPDFQVAGMPDGIPHKIGGTGGGCASGLKQGLTQVGLSSVDREPVFLAGLGCLLNAASFATWYHDDPSNKVILGKFLRLANIGAGSFQFDSSADPAYNLPNINCGNAVPTQTCAGYGGFFPINGLGFGNQVIGKNYSFTSEVRFPFTYAGGEVLSFIGDDDLWVYIGGRKVVDLGNHHPPVAGQVTLALGGSLSVPASATTEPPITLTVGQNYEIDVFQAERNSTGSNYKLTLAGFTRKISVCTPPTPVPPPATTTYTQAYTASCPTGYGPSWDFLAYSASLTGASTISFGAQTGPTTTGPWLPTPTPAAIASAPAPDPAICSLTGPSPPCPKSLATPLGMVNSRQPNLLLTATLTSSCGGGGSIGGLTTADGTAACPGPANPGACTTNKDCFQDWHCAAGVCAWNGATGYTDPACPGIDLTINATCAVAGVQQMLACNRGNTKVNAGQTLKVAIANGGPGGNSAGCAGCGTACSLLLATDLMPGTCASVPGCGLNGNRHAYVNWDNSIPECNFKNNESSAKDNGGGCPATCGGVTPPGIATLKAWNVTYSCTANE